MEQYERNQALIASNAHMKSRMEPRQAAAGERYFSECCGVGAAAECSMSLIQAFSLLCCADTT